MLRLQPQSAAESVDEVGSRSRPPGLRVPYVDDWCFYVDDWGFAVPKRVDEEGAGGRVPRPATRPNGRLPPSPENTPIWPTDNAPAPVRRAGCSTRISPDVLPLTAFRAGTHPTVIRGPKRSSPVDIRVFSRHAEHPRTPRNTAELHGQNGGMRSTRASCMMSS